MTSLAPAERPSVTAPQASFRDPAGFLFSRAGRLFRLVQPSARPDLEAFLSSATCRRLTAEGRIVRSELVPDSRARNLVPAPWPVDSPEPSEPLLMEHERIWFPSFPYEWPAEMLHAAADFTLDLADGLLPEGLGLKDASPHNILFRGPTPVFVDLLSFEGRRPDDPIWLPYAQFVRAFLLPLLASQRLGWPLGQLFIACRDGLTPEEVYPFVPTFQRLRPPCLTTISIPTWLTRRHAAGDDAIYGQRSLANPEKARFILSALFARLRRQLAGLAPAGTAAWNGHVYAAESHYTSEQIRAKEEFVRQSLREVRPATLLDLGCNAGHYAILAAEQGCRVVAVDRDPAAVGRLWRTAGSQGLDILPLVVDVARPSPAVGWLNAECASFLARAQGNFDAVLMLALLHHLLVTERVPLPEILGLAAKLTSRVAVIEYVDTGDPSFQQLARGRAHLHDDLSRSSFELHAQRHFQIVRHVHLPGSSRHLYLLRKKTL